MNRKLLPLMGIARKAGRLTLGFDAVVGAMQEGKSKLVLLASDLSPRTVRGIQKAAQSCSVEVQTIPETIEQIGNALGKDCGVLSIDDEGFATKARSLNASNGEVPEL